MSQGNPLANLQQAGYSPYQVGANPQMTNELSSFGGYDASRAAGPNYAPLSTTQNQQQALANTLQAQAKGAGPNPALAQLQQTTEGNIKNQAALSAAAGASGAGGAGAARYNAASNAGALNQQAGGQAAIQTAQQQLGAQGQEAGVLGTLAGQNLTQAEQEQQLAESNTAGANAANEFTAQQNAQRAALEQQNYEFGQGINAQAIGAQNAAVAGLQGQQEQNQQSMINAGIGGVTGGLSAGLSLLAKGGIIAGPKPVIAGEAGREAEVPVPPRDVPHGTRKAPGVPKLAAGGMVGGQPQDFSGHIAGLGGLVSSVIHGIRSGRHSMAAPTGEPGDDEGPGVQISDTPAIDPSVGVQGDFAPAQGGMAAKGRLLTQPTEIEAGEAGPEAIIPVKGDGSADMKRAKDPGVRKLIKDHPEYKHPLSAGGNDQTLSHLAELKAEVAKLEKVLKSTRRAA